MGADVTIYLLDTAGNICLRSGMAWQPLSGNLTQISAGLSDRFFYDNPAVTSQGAWSTQTNASAYAGGYLQDATAGDTLTFKFTGDSVVLDRLVDPNGGQATTPQQLSDPEKARLLTAHHSLRRREIVRYWLLSAEDIEFINLRRRDHNRLGFAVQLCLCPGWPLGPAVTTGGDVARQSGNVCRQRWERIRTRGTQSGQKRDGNIYWCCAKEYPFRQYQSSYPSLLRQQLRNEALLTDSAFTLVQSAMAWLREHIVILPALATLETAVRTLRGEVERETYDRLANERRTEHQAALDKLLDVWPSHGVCWAGYDRFRAVLADATGLENIRIAEATEGYTADRLDWTTTGLFGKPRAPRRWPALCGGKIKSRWWQWGSGRTSSSGRAGFPHRYPPAPRDCPGQRQVRP